MMNIFDLIEATNNSPVYLKERAIIQFTEAIASRMEELDMDRSVLADRMGTSASYVTKILRGDANLTLDSIAKLAYALECEVDLYLSCSKEAEGL